MTDNYFMFNGQSSQDFGIYVQEYPRVTVPEKDITEITVPGSSEPLTQWSGAFKPFPRKYKCWFDKKPGIDRARQIAEWLHDAPPGSRLEDSYRTDVFHKATFKGPMDITNLANQVGTFTVEFQCAAPAFLKSGELAFTHPGIAMLNNPTSRASFPLIQVTGSVSGLVKIGSRSLTILFSGYNDTHTFFVDFHLREAWEVVDGVEVSRNEWVNSQDFPVIDPGVNDISITGGIESVTIWPRWWTV